ncbi:hypothetical protein B1C78_08325 [Thioalkalivibrio denitrificans]|uniref:Uncharacterized protein n=1 Tax=Thioalkalivibrio denitrificans TaxID=108003 RepID=A0A1V3NHL5_9GAMM|nr:hypothetical protein [Thioalkalivibrio denitrificans]OOG24597.1 hypothetical protein B1C78_08325 [Thioalkalivibrio denitrificans]
MTPTLPDAIERERETLLENVISRLRREGFNGFEALDLPGYPDPEPLTIPVLNVRMRPDLRAEHPSEGLLLAVVEPETDLGEAACGRRWQGLAAWAERHKVRLQVFVHQEDQARAKDIARHWHLDEGLVHPVPRRG